MSVPKPNNNLEVTSQSSDTPQSELGKATSTSSQSPMPRPASIPLAPERPQGLRAKQLTGMMPPTAPSSPAASTEASVPTVMHTADSSITASAPVVLHTALSSATASAPVMHTAPSIIEKNFMLESLPQQIEELRNFIIEMSNPNFENQNPTHRIDKFEKIYSSVHLFLRIKNDLEVDRNNNLLYYPEKIKEINEEIGKIDDFEREFSTFCETNGKKLVQEVIEMQKFIEMINIMLQEDSIMLQEDSGELGYEDFSKDLYLQAKQNLAKNNINAQPDLIEHEVKNLIKHAKVIKKKFFGDAKKGPEGFVTRGIRKLFAIEQGQEIFYTEVSQRREKKENEGRLVIWHSSKEPEQPDKYYISLFGHKQGPFTERELEEMCH